MFLHVGHDLVGNFGKHFLGQHHLAAVQVVTKFASDELTEGHKLKTDNQHMNVHSSTEMGELWSTDCIWPAR